MSTRRQDDWAIVEVAGEVDVFTAPKLREQLVDLVSQGTYRIVVDLGRVEFMDSTGIGVLVGGLKRVREHEGTLALVSPTDPVRRVLSITSLNRVFPIHDSVDAALAD